MEFEGDDRISGLPRDIIEIILTLMPLRDALRTSILSSSWRFCWRTIPELTFYFRSSNDTKSIFHVLLLHRGPILEFSLDSHVKIYSEMDKILLHLSQSQRSNTIKKFLFRDLGLNSYYPLPCSLFELQRLEHLHLSFCKFESPLLLNKGFSKLKTLRLYCVEITTQMLFGLLTKSPLIEEFDLSSSDVWSFSQLVKLFECLPSLQVLVIQMLLIEPTAGRMTHKLPVSLVNLRELVLSKCYLELPYILCVITSSPNLEKLQLLMVFSGDFVSFEDYTDLKFDHMKEITITGFRDHSSWMEFVKVVMARSPILKKAAIEFYTSDPPDKQVQMLRDFPRASPTAKLVIKRR